MRLSSCTRRSRVKKKFLEMVVRPALLAPGRAQSTFILPAPKGRRCESAFALLSHQKVTKRL